MSQDPQSLDIVFAGAPWCQIKPVGAPDVQPLDVAFAGAPFCFYPGDFITGTVAVSIVAPSIAATAIEIFTGTVAVAIAAPSIAATGSEIFTGTVAVAVAVPGIAATGSEIFTGATAVAVAVPGIAAAGSEIFTGTADVPIGVPSIDAVGSVTTATSPSGAGGGSGLHIYHPQWAHPSAKLMITGETSVAVAGPQLQALGHTIPSITGTTAVCVLPPLVESKGWIANAITGACLVEFGFNSMGNGITQQSPEQILAENEEIALILMLIESDEEMYA